MHQKEGQKDDQKERQDSAPFMRLGSKSALNFPVTYLQKAGFFVQKTVTTTGVYVHKLIFSKIYYINIIIYICLNNNFLNIIIIITIIVVLT